MPIEKSLLRILPELAFLARGIAHPKRAILPPLLMMILVFGVTATAARAQLPGIHQSGVPQGSSSREFRKEAASAIPMDQLVPDAQRKIQNVLNNTALYRRLPTSQIEVDPDFLVTLVRYPEIVVETWKLMGVSQMACERIGPYRLKSDDGSGTASEIELVYGTQNIHLFYGTGTYSGNLIRRSVDAECVLLLRTSTGTDPRGTPLASNTLDVFIKIDNAMVGIAAKTLLPLVGKTADHNYSESMRFVERLNSTTEKNGPGVQGMAWKLEGLQPEVRELFINQAGIVYDRALERGQAATSTRVPGPNDPGYDPAASYRTSLK